MSKGVPQLRVRSEYSYRTAYGPVAEISKRLEEIECPAAALVDTKGTWGHVDWEKGLADIPTAPMYGRELAIERENAAGKIQRQAAWILAENSLKEFYRASSTVVKTPEGMADIAGKVLRFSGTALNDPDQFDYIDINPLSRRDARNALGLAQYAGKPLVLTSDVDYPSPASRGRFLAWNHGDKTSPQHILDHKEFRAAFSFLPNDIYRKALANTCEVAVRCSGLKLAQAPIIRVDGSLPDLVEIGRKMRLERGHIAEWTEEYQTRLQRELDMIEEKDYASYFMVVADMVCWAKERMLVGPARGSSAGSLVCYLLRITEVDPLVHDLIFERFIDINRDDLPDIDIDFNDQKRHLVFDYLKERYGDEQIARIGSISRLKPRSVIAHVGKKLGIPHGAAFGVTNVLIEYSSGDARYGNGLADTLTNTASGKEFMERYPEAALMGELENHASHSGQHAAGIIVSNVPVIEYCTVEDGIAQIDKKAAEYLNLLKIDALGLRTLGVIEDSGCVTAEQLYDLKLDDPAVFDVFNRASFSGVFQFEGAAQRRVSIQVPVTSFKQIDHVTALARPGPLGGGASNDYIQRNLGAKPTVYRHDSMRAYLGETYGVVLYQEQVMRLVREIGRFSWEDTSTIRKAMSGRKGQEFFDRHGERFVEGAAQVGMEPDVAHAVWKEICSFGAWGMNKCIAGNQRVKLAHPNQAIGPDPTIAELYEAYKESPTAWIRQRGAMPVLLCLGDDGIARPVQALDIVCNSHKSISRYTFSNGASVECTEDHKFIIEGGWLPIKVAKIGDQISFVSRKPQIKNHAFNTELGKGWRKGRSGGAGDAVNNRDTFVREFRQAQRGRACERCDEFKTRMEVHHNDHQHGKIRADDLAWLCSGCHKKVHMDAGDWLPPYARGWSLVEEPVTLKSITRIRGLIKTYDIEMPAPNHNYVLANGLVTHNSHTVSYAMISYWCAYMKHHHALEYAAACLRSAKDDEQVIEVLRELTAEGIEIIPFDADKSDLEWKAVDGRVIGGLTNIKGIGKVKGRKLIADRKRKGLTEAQRAMLANAEVKYKELRPAHAEWGHIYDNPDASGIAGQVKEFADLEDHENAVVICKLIRLDRRDENEQVRLARRQGERKPGQTLFLDCFVVDDSVSKPILARIRPESWFGMGVPIAENAVGGQDWFLVRGRWLKQFSMIIVKKIRCLNRPEIMG